jgi:hypothetical protein
MMLFINSALLRHFATLYVQPSAASARCRICHGTRRRPPRMVCLLCFFFIPALPPDVFCRYDGVRLVSPASFPARSEAAAMAGSPKPKALPKIVFEQDAFYARIRHKFPQLQKEPFSLAHGR